MKIKDWNEKFQEILNEIPAGHWLFVTGGKIYLMKLDKKGQRIVSDNFGMSSKAIVKQFDCPCDVDGGDW